MRDWNPWGHRDGYRSRLALTARVRWPQCLGPVCNVAERTELHPNPGSLLLPGRASLGSCTQPRKGLQTRPGRRSVGAAVAVGCTFCCPNGVRTRLLAAVPGDGRAFPAQLRQQRAPAQRRFRACTGHLAAGLAWWRSSGWRLARSPNGGGSLQTGGWAWARLPGRDSRWGPT